MTQDCSNTATRRFRELVASVAEGSEEAAWELTEIYSPHISRAVRASLPFKIRSKLDSFDLLQSVWASLLMDSERLSGIQEPRQFICYLAGVAKNKVVDKHRHYTYKMRDTRREVRIADLPRSMGVVSSDNECVVDLPGVEPTASEIVKVRERWQSVHIRSSKLEKEILALRLKGLRYYEIAEQLEISEKTAKRAIARMIRDFQK